MELGAVAELRVMRARELLQELVCANKFDYVWSGVIMATNSTNGFTLMQFKIYYVFKGGE